MNKKKEHEVPVVFTPENEPYLGLQSLLEFDKEISFSLSVSSHIAKYTRSNREAMTELQLAACRIVPQGINLVLSIRELIRQGYLFASLVLIRPLIERAAIISYICDHPEAIEKLKDGWKFRDRPSLSIMLQSMSGDKDLERAKELCAELNHIVHGDPIAADWNRVPLNDGSLGYSVGKVLKDHNLCDVLSWQGCMYLMILRIRATSCFPDVKLPMESI